MAGNIFIGNGQKPKYVNIIYKLLMSRKGFSYSEIYRRDPDWQGDESEPISKRDGYNECKKAFLCLKKLLGDDIETIGKNNRNQSFRYIGKEDDPLRELRQQKSRQDFKRFVQFCVDSAGFFPYSWIEHYFRDDRELEEIKSRKRRGEEVISSSLDRVLTNIGLLPFLHESIVNRQVLLIKYNANYSDEQELVFHPQYLKEYNGRWFLFGYAPGKYPEEAYNIAIDRIVGHPRYCHRQEYVSAPPGFYKKYFENLVGVSYDKKNETTDVVIRIHKSKMFNLTVTKPIHPSQTTLLEFGKHNNQYYGEIRLHVHFNSEFIARILQMGEDYEVVAPEQLRRRVAKKIAKMNHLYK